MARGHTHHSPPERLAAAADHLGRVWSGTRHAFLRDLAFAKACEAHGILLRRAWATRAWSAAAGCRPRTKIESLHGRFF